MLNTVLFDLDGTLVQHGHVLLPPLLSAWQEPRAEATVKQAFSEQIIWFYNHIADAEAEGWVDDLWRGFYSRVLQTLAIEDPHGQRADRLYRFYAGNPIPPLYSDVRPLVEQLAQHGWQLGIITQRSRAGAHRFLTAHGLAERFPVVIAGDDAHGRKPAPGPFLAALERWRVSPQQAVFVGDRIDDDCEGALNAGLGAFLIDRDDFHAWVDHGSARYRVLRTLEELPVHLPATPVLDEVEQST